MKKRTPAPSGTIRGLDGLRTLALFGVLLFHMFPRKVVGGYFGVITFFVISGFLTAWSSVRKRDMMIVSYYRKRITRIYPALIMMLFITVEAISLLDRFRLLNVQEEITSVLLAYNNYWQISMSADYFANLSSNSAFTHLWYTSILIQFEVLWPWLYMIFVKKKDGLKRFGYLVLASLLVMPIGSFIPSVTSTMLYYGTLSRIHALLIGAWAGWRSVLSVKHNRHRIKAPAVTVTIILYTIATLLIYRNASGDQTGVYRYGIVLYAIVSGVVVWMLANSNSKFSAVLDNPICRFFSRYSYEIYLWQYPVLFAFGIKELNKTPLHFVMQAAVLLVLSVWTNEFIAFMRKALSDKR